MTSIDQNQIPSQETLDEKWAGIEKSETVVVHFAERLETTRPYCMGISWNYPGSGHYDRHVQVSYETPGHFWPDLSEAAKRVVNLRTLRVLYPDAPNLQSVGHFPKLGTILPMFMSTIRLRATARLDEENLYGFIVTFGGEISSSPKLIQCPAGYDVIAEFGNMNMMEQMTTKLYIWDFTEMNNFMGTGGGFMGREMFLGIGDFF